MEKTPKKEDIDLAIIGAGPAGLTASIYASRYGIKNAVYGMLLGGQISESHLVDNYPGVENKKGTELSEMMARHAKKYGAEIIPQLVRNIEKVNGRFEIDLGEDKKITAKTVLLATGTKRRELGVQGEKQLRGKGVSYCAICDGFFYRKKKVAVVGGSDSAAGAAAHLSEIAEKVYLVYRKKQLRCEQYWKDILAKTNNLEIFYETNVVEIVGTEKVSSMRLENSAGGAKEVEIDGIFVEAGSDPDTMLGEGLGAETDEGGYIKIKKDGSTSVPGVWAAGDITDGSDKLRQIITAAAEGAIAVRNISEYLKKNS